MRDLQNYEKEIAKTISNNLASKYHKDISLVKIICDYIQLNNDDALITLDMDNNKVLVRTKGDNRINNANCYALLIDIITFIQFLSDGGYILLVECKNEKKSLYSGSTYEIFDAKSDATLKSDGDILAESCFSSYQGLAQLVYYYINKYVFPTSKLKMLVENDFNTPEQIRFKQQLIDVEKKHNEAMAKTECQIKIGWFAFIVAFITLLVTLCK